MQVRPFIMLLMGALRSIVTGEGRWFVYERARYAHLSSDAVRASSIRRLRICCCRYERCVPILATCAKETLLDATDAAVAQRRSNRLKSLIILKMSIKNIHFQKMRFQLGKGLQKFAN